MHYIIMLLLSYLQLTEYDYVIFFYKRIIGYKKEFVLWNNEISMFFFSGESNI